MRFQFDFFFKFFAKYLDSNLGLFLFFSIDSLQLPNNLWLVPVSTYKYLTVGIGKILPLKPLWLTVVYDWQLFMIDSCLWLTVVYDWQLFMIDSCLWLTVVYDWHLFMIDNCLWLTVVYDWQLFMIDSCLWLTVVYDWQLFMIQRHLFMIDNCLWLTVVYDWRLFMIDVCLWLTVVYDWQLFMIQRHLFMIDNCLWLTVVYDWRLFMIDSCLWLTVIYDWQLIDVLGDNVGPKTEDNMEFLVRVSFVHSCNRFQSMALFAVSFTSHNFPWKTFAITKNVVVFCKEMFLQPRYNIIFKWLSSTAYFFIVNDALICTL